MKVAFCFTALSAFALISPAHAGTPAASTTMSATTTASATKLTDQQIAQVVKNANDAEIDAAKIARGRAKDPQVKEFANHMITEHSKNNKMGQSVEKRAAITPANSDTSKMLQKDAMAKGAELKGADKADFDRTYIDQQVAMHTQVLKQLDSMLIPQAQNAEMKAFLEQTRMHVQKHLDMAQQIQAKLESSTNSRAVTE